MSAQYVVASRRPSDREWGLREWGLGWASPASVPAGAATVHRDFAGIRGILTAGRRQGQAGHVECRAEHAMLWGNVCPARPRRMPGALPLY